MTLGLFNWATTANNFFVIPALDAGISLSTSHQ